MKKIACVMFLALTLSVSGCAAFKNCNDADYLSQSWCR